MQKYKTIADLCHAIDHGKLSGKNIRVILDNDDTSVYLKGFRADGEDEVLIFRGNGYNDVLDLWAEVLPHADIEWC